MKEKNAKELDDEISRNEIFARRGGIAVIAGLIVEVTIAVIFHEDRTANQIVEKWSLVFANALIALGVFGELFFARKALLASARLKEMSDEKVTEANARAAEANERTVEAQLELAKLWERVARRVVTPEMREKLKGLQGLVAEIAVTWQGSAEPAKFAWEIVGALKQPGILVSTPPSPAGAWAAGVFVVYPASMDELRKRAIGKALACLGVVEPDSGLRPWDIGDAHSDLVIIFVGDKPFPGDSVADQQ